MATTTRTRLVSQKVARAVLHSRLVGDTNLGIDGGGWARKLIELICASDKSNRALLTTVYPEWVIAVDAVQHEHWGIEWLRNISREVARVTPDADDFHGDLLDAVRTEIAGA